MKFTIQNPMQRDRMVVLEGLVDTGAHFTQVPRSTLEQIGITPFGTRRVQYADGTVVSKPVASAEILIDPVCKVLVSLATQQAVCSIGGS